MLSAPRKHWRICKAMQYSDNAVCIPQLVSFAKGCFYLISFSRGARNKLQHVWMIGYKQRLSQYLDGHCNYDGCKSWLQMKALYCRNELDHNSLKSAMVLKPNGLVWPWLDSTYGYLLFLLAFDVITFGTNVLLVRLAQCPCSLPSALHDHWAHSNKHKK